MNKEIIEKEIIMGNEIIKANKRMIAKLEEVQSELNSCRDLAIEAYKNMPEDLRNSEYGDLTLKRADFFNNMCHVIIGTIARLTYMV